MGNFPGEFARIGTDLLDSVRAGRCWGRCFLTGIFGANSSCGTERFQRFRTRKTDQARRRRAVFQALTPKQRRLEKVVDPVGAVVKEVARINAVGPDAAPLEQAAFNQGGRGQLGAKPVRFLGMRSGEHQPAQSAAHAQGCSFKGKTHEGERLALLRVGKVGQGFRLLFAQRFAQAAHPDRAVIGFHPFAHLEDEDPVLRMRPRFQGTKLALGILDNQADMVRPAGPGAPEEHPPDPFLVGEKEKVPFAGLIFHRIHALIAGRLGGDPQIPMGDVRGLGRVNASKQRPGKDNGPSNHACLTAAGHPENLPGIDLTSYRMRPAERLRKSTHDMLTYEDWAASGIRLR